MKIFHLLCLLALVTTSHGQTPQRVVPEKGVVIDSMGRQHLQERLEDFGRRIGSIKWSYKDQPKAYDLIPDIEIYYNAVKACLDQDTFYSTKELATANQLLKEGEERYLALANGQAPWLEKTGLVVRGYFSRIDGSAQPYGLEIPTNYKPDATGKYRLDFWYQGRNNKLTELRFIDERSKKKGPFAPINTIVLHPYGRYCNANKFAGEVDSFEALEHAKRYYPIDDDKISVRGFSMGGAVVWHMAAHHAGLWAAAAPGAGFAETSEYQNSFAKDPKPAWWEQKLWNLYDATVVARNLKQVPIVAYSGENDKQMQAANIMMRFMEQEGIKLPHIIGPGMGHKYHPDSKKEIEAFVTKATKAGVFHSPREVSLTTYTLRYNKMLWATIDELKEHWKRSDLHVRIDSKRRISVNTTNVISFSFDLPAGEHLEPISSPTVSINGKELLGVTVKADGSWKAHFAFRNNAWVAVPQKDQKKGFSKKHLLQGPIDDAFMDSFIFVKPTGRAASPEVQKWTEDEFNDAIYQWKTQFRGEPRVMLDHRVKANDIRDSNLILFGDPQSNRLLARYIGRLPLYWSSSEIRIGTKTFSAKGNIPVMIHPNPDSPSRYIVINSSFTFSRNGNQSNSTQVPKLADWAILKMNVPPNKRIPAGVVDTDFFDEAWRFKISPENPNK
ncbi:prolyl oligopeptidase family serine peptidase [Verrucomicrobia bacterium]|nr:prolyl oligopeptidase family serine peptidase [Verrucomicrobiota bacterium]